MQDCPLCLGLQESMEGCKQLCFCHKSVLGAEAGIFARNGPAETLGVSL